MKKKAVKVAIAGDVDFVLKSKLQNDSSGLVFLQMMMRQMSSGAVGHFGEGEAI